MPKNLDINNSSSNSDSNSILKTIVIILAIAGIAYIIYYLYIQYSTEKVGSELESESEPISKLKREKNIESYNTKNVDQSNPYIQEEGISSVNFKMNGKLEGNSNPIMNKINMLPSGKIIGEDNIEHFSQNQEFKDERNATSFPKEQLTADELLPQDNSSLWAQVNPSGEGSLKDRNFLQSGYHIGINTVGQTLRNANLQLRSEPPCPQVKVSPWLQATIEPDVSRKPFEIGGCA